MGMLLEADPLPAINQEPTGGAKIGEFNRIEDKHVVRTEFLEQILATLNQEMLPSYFHNETKFTLIESLYFDSSNLDFFKHHFSGMESRHKLRSRRYAPNGVWSNSPALLELKTKKAGSCFKTRFSIPSKAFDRLISAEEIVLNQELVKLNENVEMAALLRRVEKVNELTQKYHLRPNVSVTYHRYAFEKDDFRVTVDTNIKVNILKPLKREEALAVKGTDFWEKALKIINKYDAEANFVLETKHQGVIPAWMLQLMDEVGVKKTSFSKYCWGIAKEVELKSSLLQ